MIYDEFLRSSAFENCVSHYMTVYYKHIYANFPSLNDALRSERISCLGLRFDVKFVKRKSYFKSSKFLKLWKFRMFWMILYKKA